MTAPADVTIRSFQGDDDYTAFADILEAASQADAVPWAPGAEQLRIEHEDSDGISPAADMLVAALDGRPVAVAGVNRSVRDGVATFEMFGHVHPDVRRRGIGTILLERNLARTAERVALEPPDMPVQGGAFVEETEIGHRVLLERAGFRVIRHFFLMRRPDLGSVPDVPLPDGLQIRPVTTDQHRVVWEAQREAFRDHWNHREVSESDYRQSYALPDLDTTLWVVAWDGDEIAGVVEPWIWRDENAKLGVRRGWLERISVRRPWRRRGVARALTAIALSRLRDAGMDDAMLGVDSESPTGALSLYQGLGFEVYSRAAAYHLDLTR